MRHLAFLFLLCMFLNVHGDDVMSKFITDVISTLKLISPTILYHGNLPEICMTLEWILCLDQENDHIDLAEHISMLYEQRRQDSVLITDINSDLLAHLTMLVPSMFRSNSPIFMPLEFSNKVELKLDSNIIFYEEKGHGKFNMVDKFAVNGGQPLVLQMGTWDEINGAKLEMRVNRWDRRTDLMGATFLNTLWPNDKWADFIYDNNGTIIGSKGWFQEKLFYITDRLNMQVKIREEVILIEGNPTEKLCDGDGGLLLLNLTDVCSGGMPITFRSSDGFMFDMPIATDRRDHTLLAGTPSGTAPDAWVYIEIFDFPQWLIFFSIMLVISLAMLFMEALSDAGSGTRSYEGITMTLMFSIQQGSHPERRHMSAQRVLALTTSMLTLLVFIYYSNDITAKMTAGSPPIPVRTFDDVLERGYKVIVVGQHHPTLLRESKTGTAKHSVYKLFFEEDLGIIDKYFDAMNQKTHEQFMEEGGEALPEWYDWTQENFVSAVTQIINDPKTLWYCGNNCFPQAIMEGKVVALDMDDTLKTWGGFYLRPNSEYLSVFNHYLLKAFETGILQKLDNFWNAETKPVFKIGINEPEPLGINNVMFLFSLLGASIIISLVLATVENLVKKLMTRIVSRSQVTTLVFNMT